MNIKQMHIAFDQGTQYLASNRARAFFPEEKDMILNKMIGRYIISRLRPKGDGVYEIDSMAQEQLKTLIARISAIPAEIKGSNYSLLLPSDLGWYVAGVVNFLACTPTAVTNLTRYKHVLTFPKSTKGSAKYYETASLHTSSLAAINTLQSGSWLGLPSKEQVFDVIPQLVQDLRAKGIPVYMDGQRVTLYLGNATPINGVADAATVASTPTTEISNVYTESTAATKAPIRIVPTASVFDVNSTPYWRSNAQSVVGSFSNSSLNIEGPSSGIITSGDVIYVRKPRVVSLSLGSNSDLPEEYHDELIDMAVAYAKTELNSPDWEKKLADNKLNTTI